MKLDKSTFPASVQLLNSDKKNMQLDLTPKAKAPNILNSDKKKNMQLDVLEQDPLSFFSHEIKTPLSVFQLGLSLLEKDFEKNKNIIPLMKEELKFLNHLIQNVLDLRIIQNKKELLSYQWHNFSLILEKLCSSFEISAKKRGISFDIQKTQPIEVFIDDIWIACVLKNLLSNAIRFSFDKKAIKIKLKWTEGEKLFCSISNEGPLKIESEKVFNLFYTKSLTPKTKGTGLGLSIVKSIIQAHKGEVGVNSSGKETSFFFLLPKARLIQKTA